jgi:Ni,Fe-hydrogenase III large subunit/Ni,Fe-hydrogenase III component G
VLADVVRTLRSTWPSIRWDATDDFIEVRPPIDYMRTVAEYLHAHGWRLGTIVATDREVDLEVRYFFYAIDHPGWTSVVISVDPVERTVPSITPVIIAADWFEREIDDLFSITFLEHPRLGDFVLHDSQWAENVGLMQPRVRASEPIDEQQREWHPKRVLEEEGAFVMPVGPVYSGEAESALFLLETIGEDVVRAIPRLFYKYRAIEKLAEGRRAHDVLLLAERCSGTSAIGNGLAYCHAIERALGIVVPPRAQALRAFFAELERMRHHMTSIREICASTSLIVAESQALWLEEQLLRISGETAGHRYLFGLLAIGGLMRDYSDSTLECALRAANALTSRIDALRNALQNSSSFLDRIERVGIVSERAARAFELLGPFARASGVAADLRKTQPYGPYAGLEFGVPTEAEGDGYARLRVLFAEMGQSQRIMQTLCDGLPGGEVRVEPAMRASHGLGWTEAPRGASVQWAELDDAGFVLRYRLTPPSFRNWHGFHVATEEFAFQDFPIILATLDLSVAENDR